MLAENGMWSSIGYFYLFKSSSNNKKYKWKIHNTSFPSVPQARILWIIPRFQYLPYGFCSVSYNKDLLANFFEQGKEAKPVLEGAELCLLCYVLGSPLLICVDVLCPLKSLYPCGGSLLAL